MEYISDDKYLFLDLEWANPKNKSISQAGLVSWRNYDTDDKVFEVSEYIDPRDNYEFHSRKVSGISEKTTRKAPDFVSFWKRWGREIENHIIVGHNVRGADLDAIAKNMARYGLGELEIDYIDTCLMAQDRYPHLGSWSLGSLTEDLGLPEYAAHDAKADAIQSARLFFRLVRDGRMKPLRYIDHYSSRERYFDTFHIWVDEKRTIKEAARLKGLFMSVLAEGIENIAVWNSNSVESILESLQIYPEEDELGQIIKELRTKSLDEIEENLSSYIRRLDIFLSKNEDPENELLGLLEGIVADKRVSEREIAALDMWLNERSDLLRNTPFSSVVKAVDEYRRDDDSCKFCSTLSRIVDPLSEGCDCDCGATVEGKHFCISGTFDAGSKNDVAAMITEHGGIMDNTVKKSTTDYLVLGNQGDPSWKGTNYGTKGQNAIKFGKKIISEDKLMEMLGKKEKI